MIIDCISDLHGYYPKLESGDLLIVAGDLTARDTYRECHDFGIWLANQKYRRKIVIAGNHDNKLFGKDSKIQFVTEIEDGSIFSYATYLCDSKTEFEGLKIWGSPWTKTFEGMNPHCKAFTCETEEELAIKFSLIPDDIDILITHSPPHGILDANIKTESCGSASLRGITLDGKKFPKKKLHVFGHIHECGGKLIDLVSCKFVNASLVNEHYEPVNKPVRITL